MLEMTLRQIDLLQKLIDNENFKIKDFAEFYNISTRTVYREVSSINKFINKFNMKITNTDKGMELNGEDKDIMNLKLNLSYSAPMHNYKSKKDLILIELLQSKDPIKIQYFANKFNVSNTTISNYLKDIKKWLSSENIDLISKPGVGVYIKTDEKNIRHAIVDLLYRNYNTDQLIGLVMKNYENFNTLGSNTKNELNIRLLNIIDYKTIFIIEKALDKLEDMMNYAIEDRLYIELSIHLALAIKRLLNGEKINLDKSALTKLKNSEEYISAKIIANYIEKEINIKIPEEEIGYITIHLQGVRIGSTNLNLNENLLYLLTDTLIEDASKVFNVNFKEDSILKKDLNMHLLYSVYRMKSGYKIRNPLIDDIKREYKDIFNKCYKLLDLLRNTLKLEVIEDEVGYIAMHFAASIERMKNTKKQFDVILVCSSGIGMSRMLAARLKNIQQLNIIATSSVLKIDEILKKYKLDAIISTIPIKRNDIKVIVINPLFNQSDIDKLEKELSIKISMNREKEIAPYKDTSESLKSIKVYSSEIDTIVKNTFFTEIYSVKVEEIIGELLNELIKNSLISTSESEEIKALLLNREKLGTIILPNKNFAIYHCTSKRVNQCMVTIGRVENSLILNNLLGEKEKILTTFLMIAPENRKESLEVIGDLSSSIIEYSKFVEKINTSSSLSECKLLIENVLLKKFYKEILRALN